MSLIECLWRRLAEPRVVTAFYGAMWTCIAAAGAVGWWWPPRDLLAAVGPVLALWWAFFATTGGAAGLIGCLPGWWWLERVGIGLSGTALGMLAVAVYTSPADGTGVEALLLTALGCVFGARWVKIRGLALDPRRGGLNAGRRGGGVDCRDGGRRCSPRCR